MTFRLELAPEARDQLRSIYRYIAEQTGPNAALGFTRAILDQCRSLTTFPHRGTPRDDLRAGLRIVGFRRTVAIAFEVEGDVVRIGGILYGGRDYEKLFNSPGSGPRG
jgi:toxin ParE1/3/4